MRQPGPNDALWASIRLNRGLNKNGTYMYRVHNFFRLCVPGVWQIYFSPQKMPTYLACKVWEKTNGRFEFTCYPLKMGWIGLICSSMAYSVVNFSPSLLLSSETVKLNMLACKYSGPLTDVTPEALTGASLKPTLTHLYKQGQLSLVAIDEAHCISSWGPCRAHRNSCAHWISVSSCMLR